MITRKLYYEDPYLTTFSAYVLSQDVDPDQNRPYVILDQTAFYPTGGGQPYDTGILEGIVVLAVETVDGEIRHYLEYPLPQGNDKIEGKIDWPRRIDLMQQHNGQHILSAAFEQLFLADTVGFHLGSEYVTIDVEMVELSLKQVEIVERLANQIVLENRQVQQSFVSEEEWQRLPLRTPPKVKENVRIVTIDGFDYSPCGGTHPKQTGETGPIHIVQWERYKGKQRVSFVCGGRALQRLNEMRYRSMQLTSILSTGEKSLISSVEALIADRKTLEKQNQEYKDTLFYHQAQDMVSGVPFLQNIGQHPFRLFVGHYPTYGVQDLQKLAQIMTVTTRTMVLLVGGTDKISVVCARSSDLPFSMKHWLQTGLAPFGGKGGGQDHIAQGGISIPADFESILAAFKSSLLQFPDMNLEK